MHARCGWAFLFFFSACGGAPPPEGDTVVDTGGGEGTGQPAGELSEVQRLNARAREGAVTETLHGVEIADPYLSLIHI